MRKWNIIEELSTPDAIVGFLASVFAREHTSYEVCQAINIASKAIAAHNLVLEDSMAAEESTRRRPSAALPAGRG